MVQYCFGEYIMAACIIMSAATQSNYVECNMIVYTLSLINFSW